MNASDLVRVAKKYLCPDFAVISVVLPEDYEHNTKQISNLTTKEPKLVKTDKNVSKYELPNGATVLINKNPLNDIVAFQIFGKRRNFC